jgi:feruloyl esterase
MPGGTIESAEMIRAGETAGSTFTGAVKAPRDLCRVRAVASTAPTSRIRIEIWLPADWNGKLMGIGGGGLNGGLGSSLGDMAASIARGYAGVISDLGHDINGGTRWGLDPARVEDFGHLGNHVAAEAGKDVVARFYGRGPSRNYFQGCSGGGREALMLAQRYPADYDGIIAGAPAADFVGLMSAGMWNAQRVHRTPEAAGFPAKLKLLRAGVSRSCDALDGVADGVIDDPLACRFDPAELQCKPGAEPATCLSSAEVGIAREIYRGAHLSDGTRILAGYPYGSEADFANPGLGWGPFITENGIGAKLLGTEFFRWLVHRDGDWQAKSFLLDRDYAAAMARPGPAVNATNPDLRPFLRRGGKLLMYHGWEDAAIPAGATLDYYAAMRRRSGSFADKGVRLFMLPGVAHCNGGPGPGIFDRLDILERWVEGGVAPNQLIARKYENDMLALEGKPTKELRARPVCAWPRIARYTGKGSTDDPANFRCVRPRR